MTYSQTDAAVFGINHNVGQNLILAHIKNNLCKPKNNQTIFFAYNLTWIKKITNLYNKLTANIVYIKIYDR